MKLFHKALLVIVVLLLIIIVICCLQTIQIMAKEGFETMPLEAKLESAGDIDKIVQGDIKSEGGMSNLDNLDGTGSGPEPEAEAALGKPEAEAALGKPEAEAALGKPEAALGKPEAALGKPEAALGKPEDYIYKNEPFGSTGQNLTDMTLGVVPMTEPGGEHGYPKQTHGVRLFKSYAQGEYGEVNNPNTYSYIEDIIANGTVTR
jgi:hypothetical protein